MKTIIVGANESPTAAKAAEQAGALCAALGAHLIVVTAFDEESVDVVGIGSDTFILSTSQQAIDFATQTASALQLTHGIDAEGIGRQGKPADVLLDVARERSADLIVVGNVRMQGAGRLLGSVANHIAHHAPCDVYIVKTV